MISVRLADEKANFISIWRRQCEGKVENSKEVLYHVNKSNNMWGKDRKGRGLGFCEG